MHSVCSMSTTLTDPTIAIGIWHQQDQGHELHSCSTFCHVPPVTFLLKVHIAVHTTMCRGPTQKQHDWCALCTGVYPDYLNVLITQQSTVRR